MRRFTAVWALLMRWGALAVPVAAGAGEQVAALARLERRSV
jgi:hypothetical protein